MRKKIIVGYDGTGQANDALHLGAAFARALGARLLVASAVEFRSLDGPRLLDATASTQIDHAAHHEARAEHFERIFDQAHIQLAGAEYERHPLHGTAAHALSALAELVDADLVVLGSTHHGRVRSALSGTVAARLLHDAPCAIAVAPHGWSEHRHSRIRVVGVGYDGSEESKTAAVYAARLAAAFAAKLKLISVAPSIGVDARLDDVLARRAVWAERLRQGVSLVSSDLETEPSLRQGREATELAIEGADLDLLVVGSGRYGPLRRALAGSVSSELVRMPPCPVVVAPGGVGTRPRTLAEAGAAGG